MDRHEIIEAIVRDQHDLGSISPGGACTNQKLPPKQCALNCRGAFIIREAVEAGFNTALDSVAQMIEVMKR